jgi:tetratricopeptide (TPR) repeat protein
VDRGLAVHAGSNAQALSRVGRRWAALAALAVMATASAADAKPKRRDAKAAYDRGVVAYQKGNFEAAAAALAKSFELERDPETLFAWAQAERKLDRCDRASDLYERLLTFNLPAQNRTAVEQLLAECRALAAPAKPVEPPAAPVVEPKLQPAKPPEPGPTRVVTVETGPSPSPVDSGPGRYSWYKDPVALGLIGVGTISLGAGVGLSLSAKSLDSDSKRAADGDDKNFQRAKDLGEQARSRGNLGALAGGAGAVLVIGGVVWAVFHRSGIEQPTVTGWLTPEGGGVAYGRAF